MRIAFRSFAIILLLALLPAAFAGTKKSNASSSSKMVDEGSLGVFVNGQRVGTETFTITQSDKESVIKQNFRVQNNKVATVSSEMHLSPAGELVRYDWQGDEGRSTSNITPDEQILRQSMLLSGAPKAVERQYILPPSTMILDDYAFIHRELLAWRYVASGCAKPSNEGCALPPAQFGILIPTEQTSSFANVEFVGREKVDIRGAQKELSRFNMKSEATGDWQLWLDDNHMMVKIAIPETKTEVVRD